MTFTPGSETEGTGRSLPDADQRSAACREADQALVALIRTSGIPTKLALAYIKHRFIDSALQFDETLEWIAPAPHALPMILLVDELMAALEYKQLTVQQVDNVLEELRPQVSELWNAALNGRVESLFLTKPDDTSFRLELQFLHRAVEQHQGALSAT